MGTCKFCGKDAGWFSSSHKECREKNLEGMDDLRVVINSYFAQKATMMDVYRAKNRLMVDAYLSEEDICNVAEAEIRQYTASIHRPFTSASMKMMDDFLNVIGIAYHKINENGAVDEFTKKLMRGFMVEYFTDQLSLSTAHSRCEKVLSKFPMSPSNIEDAYYYVLNKAATNFLKNGIITDDEQRKIDDFVSYLSLSLNTIPAKYKSSDISKLGQVTILKNIQRGIVPLNTISVPILLGKRETILWTYNDVTLYQEKITKEWIGRTSGFNIRIMKGVYYRTGQMKGKPVEHSTMELNGIGTLYITNINLIFLSSQKAIKIPFNKIIGITPYSDGVEVHKDGTKQNRIAMQGFDPWFLMNLLSQINNI